MPHEQPDQLSIDDSGPRVRLAVPAMTRVLALLVAVIPTVMLTLAEDQSRQNKSEGSDSFDVEPPIFKQKLQSAALGRLWHSRADALLLTAYATEAAKATEARRRGKIRCESR